MLVRNLMLAAIFSAGALWARDSNTLTPDLGQLPGKDFNKLLMKSLAQGTNPLILRQMPTLQMPRERPEQCAIRLHEYQVHDLDAAASARIPSAVTNSDRMGMAPPVPACP